MKKKKKVKIFKKLKEKTPRLVLPEETKKWILGVIFFILAIIVSLSFFEEAGIAGRALFSGLTLLVGKTIFTIPLILVAGGLVFFYTQYKKFLWADLLGISLLILGISGVLGCVAPELREGGYLGYAALPLLKLFDFWITQIIFAGVILSGIFIFWHLLRHPSAVKEEKPIFTGAPAAKPSLIKRIFAPHFKVKEIEPKIKETPTPKLVWGQAPELKVKETPQKAIIPKEEYQKPPSELLDSDKGVPLAGDVRINSAIIKRTLENFSISVEMSEINIGPTVTQYTLKPADGIKLSKITTLSNDLSLALASHPIRIEAPIPGRPLVGIEIPNRVRTQVRLKDLIQNPQFQSLRNLTFVLGRDVSGNPCYADLARMPHLLVAGSTGTGKTIFLNSLILSLLYQNSPEILRFILIDPKRVEFPVYQDLPHLLCPVIFDAQKTVNVLKWLVLEMERRFDLLSEEKCRDIASFNEMVLRNGESPMPYIILIIDELADLMAARGREVEAGIVRLAQMARAVGIHLVVATQRPSVDVITGLIKANITSRITFQVASQVDSRTVLDMAGAEKLLGSGDMLFISAEIVKPKRIQGAYVSEKEVKKVVNYIKTQNAKFRVPAGRVQKEEGEILDYTPPPPNELAEDLEKTLEVPETEFEGFYGGEDPLYEEAKRVVVEARKASASLLQRRLRIGYARAARLIDMLEQKGVVGPGEGAKPREILLKFPEEEKDYNPPTTLPPKGRAPEDDEGWQKL